VKSLGVILRNYASELVNDLGYATKHLMETLSNTISMIAVGCWHRRMGRPRTIGGVTYRVCLDCGAQRSFDLKSWEMYGPYSYNLSGVGATSPGKLLEFRPAQSRQAEPAQVLEEAA
jgi:hypothetical protein